MAPSANLLLDIAQTMRDEPADWAALDRACAGIAARLGFEFYVFGSYLPPEVQPREYKVLSNYPAAWKQHYDELRCGESDPVLLALRGGRDRVWWDRLGPQPPQAQKVMQLAAEHGLRQGLSVGRYGSSNGFCVLSLATVSEAAIAEPHRVIIEAGADLAVTCLDRWVRRLQSPAAPAKPLLSTREKQCLALCANGHTAEEIGTALRIKARTVAFHLDRCVQKLNVGSRREAVSKAILEGLILSLEFNRPLEPGRIGAVFSEN